MSVILICGLNGSGKSTLGRDLSKTLDYSFLNDEDYYFLESEIPFSKSRSDGEACKFVLSHLRQNKNCVIVSSHGDLGAEINSLYDTVVYLSAPLEIRIERIKRRDFDKYGSRVLVGGDMYEQQWKFYEFAAARTAVKVEKWLETLLCPVIKLDGTKNIAENIKLIVSKLDFMQLNLENKDMEIMVDYEKREVVTLEKLIPDIGGACIDIIKRRVNRND